MRAAGVKFLTGALVGFILTVAGIATAQVGGPLMGSADPSVVTGGSLGFGTAADLYLVRDGAQSLAQRNGTNAQAFRVYNTWTDASNYERLGTVWSGNTILILTQSAGTGSARGMALGTTGAADLNLRTTNTDRWTINSTGHFFPPTDNTLDIGATGATRPRSVYVATDASAPKFRARGGTTPTMGACGTSPSVAGNDSGMLITVGTGGVATSCAVTFSSTWTTAPVCVAQNSADRVAYSMATTATTLTITATAAFTASTLFHVICMGVA